MNRPPIRRFVWSKQAERAQHPIFVHNPRTFYKKGLSRPLHRKGAYGYSLLVGRSHCGHCVVFRLHQRLSRRGEHRGDGHCLACHDSGAGGCRRRRFRVSRALARWYGGGQYHRQVRRLVDGRQAARRADPLLRPARGDRLESRYLVAGHSIVLIARPGRWPGRRGGCCGGFAVRHLGAGTR